MNILITGAWSYNESNISEIEKMGHKIFFQKNEKDPLNIDADKIEAVICNALFLYHAIDKFKSLKYVQLTSAGLDRIDVNYIVSHNIKLHNAKGVYSIPIAEFALCGVLQLYKYSRFFYKNQKNHKWEKNRALIELFGKNVLIVGCGSVGNECALRFKAFGCNVYGIDKKPYNNDIYNSIYELSMLDEKLSFVDIVVLSLPLTEDTYHLFNGNRLDLMKKGSVIVNISRGAIIDICELQNCLQKNIVGAVLDVFEDEPLDTDSNLWDMENVLISPHNSFVGNGNQERLANVIINNLKNF